MSRPPEFTPPLFLALVLLVAAAAPLPAEVLVFADGFETGNPVLWSGIETEPCTAVGDTDGDRLDDCVESDSGRFVDANDRGTDPFLADTDGDGIDDGDEALGTLAGLDLPALGADPLVRNVLFEYDWFDDHRDPGTCGAHSHRPTAAALAMVTAAFAAASGTNPDGSTGIATIHDAGQGAPLGGGNLVADADGVLTFGVNNSEFVNIKNAQFAADRKGYFHYVLLPHRYNTNSTSSGQAEYPGDDMIVSLYCAGTDQNVAHTIVHEVGHNFDLGHGGFEDCNRKPNYNSVMNYNYQFPGVDTNCTPPGNGLLDYSRGTRIDLDETDLDENLGTCGDSPWDWDGDALIEVGVVRDLNLDGSGVPQNGGCDANLTVLRDFDDWAAIDLPAFLFSADGPAPRAPREIVDCDNPPPGSP